MSKYREFWVFKGTSDFCADLVMNDDFEFVKTRPDGFYDIVQTKDTIECGTHVIEYSALEQAEAKIRDLEAKLAIAVEALEFCALGETQFDGVEAMYKSRQALEKLRGE